MQYPLMFSEGKIGNVTIKNRVVMPPMEVGVGKTDGTPGEQMISYYEARAKGGVGLIITETTRVNEKHGALAPGQLALSSDRHIEPFRKMVDRVHKHGTKIFVQLHHPGRQTLSLLVAFWQMSQVMGRIAPPYWKVFFNVAKLGDKIEKTGLLPSVVSASDIPCRMEKQKTRALTKKEIKELVGQFASAARRAKEAGADGVELHAAHGYLIQQFLSPYTNRRTDEYGGSFENRMRFITEIYHAVRGQCGKDFPVIVRLSVDEFYRMIGEENQGIELDEGVKIAKYLENLGVDGIDVSSASYETMNYWLEPTTFEPGWRKHLAKAVKDNVHIPVLAANMIRSPEQAEKQLEEGCQDFVNLGRPLICDPEWVNKAQSGREDEIKRCLNCLFCMESLFKNSLDGKCAQCSVNPRFGREFEIPEELPKDGYGRTVVVVGAGAAGLMAAETLSRRGFKVIVLEKNAYVGGQLQLADKPPHKEKIGWCYTDLEKSAVRNGAEIRLNTTATVDMIREINPYAVVIATGGEAVKPRIPGYDKPHVYTTTQALDGSAKLTGKRVAVIGSGMTGLETAEKLVEDGNSVFIVEMADEVAPGTYHQQLEDALPKLEKANVEILTSTKLVKINDDSVELEGAKNGMKSEKKADAVVLAVGVRSVNDLVEETRKNFNTVVVGDADKVGRIANATRSAFDAALSLK